MTKLNCMCCVKWIESRIQIEIIKYREAENTNLLSSSSVKQVQQVIVLRSQNIFFCMKSKNTVFLRKTIEKAYLNLHFKFHDFFFHKRTRYEDFKFLGFFFPNINQFSLASL